MMLLEKLGRQTIRIGSSSACDICLEGPGVAPIHAEVIHQGAGRLSFIPGASGKSFRAGRELDPGQIAPFDFRTPFHVGEVPLPAAHFELCLMVMTRGHLPVRDDELKIGRDPERSHLVLNSPGVSGAHATLALGTKTSVTDHHSTSGTWLNGARLEAERETDLDDEAILAVGPLPLPVNLARKLLLELKQIAVAPRAQRATEAMPRRTEERKAVASRQPSIPMAKHRTVMGTIKMASTATHTIGRTSDNDIVLDYPQISGKHARLTSVGSQLFLEDLGSELGTAVRGTRLKPGQKAQVGDGERVRFGPMPALLSVNDERVDVVVEDHEGWAGRPLFNIAAANVSVRVPDREDPQIKKTLLENVSFKALPGDLIALMGPSGSGKTTLLHALTGYVLPEEGEVLVNETPLGEIFETLRGSIGYVPQDDIIHPELTVREAVRYSARFRLPADYKDDEIETRVTSTLSQLGLESVAHLQIGRPEAKVLSGGQRKRVNIAMELVTDPVLLFLDEPTSGLAADDTTSLIDLLARLAQESGKTIIATIHQPARDEYEKFNLALVLGHGGIPLYFGPTERAYAFFESWREEGEARGIESPRDMFAELSEREARFRDKMPGTRRFEVRQAVSHAYRHEYEKSDISRELASTSRSVSETGASTHALPNRKQPRGQLRLLLSRYLKIKMRDRVGTAILLLQAPIIGALLSLVFGMGKEAIPYWCLGALNELSSKGKGLGDAATDLLSRLSPAADNAGALFFLIVAAVWFGTSNASREIVSERAIFRRERMVNLGVRNYVLSKFIILSGLCLVQCAVLLGIVFFSLGLAGGATGFLAALTVLSLTAICSVALGLMLSTVVSSSEAAMALTPLALIPQVVLGGLMVPVTTNPWLAWPMRLAPSRWGFEGIVRIERDSVATQPGWQISLPGVPDSLPDFVLDEHFQCALAQMQSLSLRGAWGFNSPAWMPSAVLAGMTFCLLAGVGYLLKRRY